MADISKEIQAFQNAVFGEEVRGSMISLCEKVNKEQEDVVADYSTFKNSVQADAQYIYDNMPQIQNAKQYADNAQASETNAKASEELAKQYADQASQVVGIGIATTSTLGLVKIPTDGTITIDTDGTIHGAGGTSGGGLLPELYIISEDDCTVTVTNGSITLNPSKKDNTTWYTTIPSFGTWVIHSVNSLGDVTYELEVDTVKVYRVTNTHFSAYITVNYTEGASVTLSNNGQVIRVSSSGERVTVHSTGNWIATATFDAQTSQSEMIPITADGQSETVTLDSFAKVTITYDANTIGKTITLAKDSKIYSKVATSSLSVDFVVNVFGAWELSAQTVSKSVNIPSKGVYTFEVSGGNNYQGWLDSASITDSFSSLEDVLADEKTVRTLMTKHSSVDYLKEWLENDDTLADVLLTSDSALKWIGLRDYAYDNMPSEFITSWLGGAKWEYALKDKVPTMTSDSAPYGTIFGSDAYSANVKVNAFDGNDATFYCPNSNASGTYIGYSFVNPICVRKIKIKQYTDLRIVKCQLRGSNTGTNDSDFVNIGAEIEMNGQTDKEITFDNDNYYKYYCLKFTSVSNRPALCTLQFYGRSLTVSVPTMTSNTSPYGEVTSSAIYSSGYEAYRAFDNVNDSRFISNSASGYIQYKFNAPTCVKRVLYNSYNYASASDNQCIKDFKIQGSNDGNVFTDLYSGTNASGKGGKNNVYEINNNELYQYYRFTFTSLLQGSNASIDTLNFYCADYSEHAERHWIYDNGVELEEIVARVSNSNVTKNSNNIFISKSDTKVTTASTNYKINITPYKNMRAVLGDIVATNGGMVLTSTTSGEGTCVVGLNNLPYNFTLDVSAVNEDMYCKIGYNSGSNYTASMEVKEWWLE